MIPTSAIAQIYMALKFLGSNLGSGKYIYIYIYIYFAISHRLDVIYIPSYDTNIRCKTNFYGFEISKFESRLRIFFFFLALSYRLDLIFIPSYHMYLHLL